MLLPSGKFRSLFLFCLLCLLCGGIFTLLSMVLSHWVLGWPMEDLQNVFSDLGNPENLRLAKFFQLSNSLGLFLLPALLYLKFIPNQIILKYKSFGPWLNYGLVLVLFLVFTPFLNYSIELNKSMHLPEALSGVEQWMRNSEDHAERLTQAFIRMDDWTDLLFNVLLIGILPAFGEELVFRGVVQRTINRGKKHPHFGIWISAVLFSAIHVQFFGFFPRLFLGAFFGYLLAWSGNIWMPIFAHFINNTSALLLVYYLGNDALEEQVNQLGASEGQTYLPWISLALFLVLMFRFKRAQKNHPIQEN